MTADVKLYGIKNCDTIRKARAWLVEHGQTYSFHDYKTQGIDAARLQKWSGQVGWEKLLNKAGTTFRKLPDTEKHNLTAERTIALMVAHPSLIKRPVLETENKLEVGFKPENYTALLTQK